MKIKLSFFSIFLLTIIVTSGFGLSIISKIASVNAQITGQNSNFSPNNVPNSHS